ncbi:hypothetical protein HZY91_10515 [Facklamia sp. DSM 111018]|uniref:Uncharacterized protein n=1 Tax=Facklamia lactis TaxID=2749967 RepID=A0ABS0LT46_9LACT|nr:hypothetical protein [Facklamia lactis]MBG9987299.1 hypothetical protein [Facklamia lactis]
MKLVKKTILTFCSIVVFSNVLSINTIWKSDLRVRNTVLAQSEPVSWTVPEVLIGVWQSEDGESQFALTHNGYFSTNNEGYQVVETQTIDNGDYQLSFDSLDYQTNSNSMQIKHQTTEDTIMIDDVIFVRHVDSNIINFVKDKVAGLEPINLEQLLRVSDHHLMAYHLQSIYKTDEAMDLAQQMRGIYNNIADGFPELELLVDSDYEDYQELAQLIMDQSEWTFSLLNTALPKDILNWYRDLSNQYDNDSQLIEALLPKIEKASNDYFQRKEQSEVPYLENYEWGNDSYPADSEDPHLLAESEYELRDGKFDQEEAYTILVKALGLEVDYNTGEVAEDGGAYVFTIDGEEYRVFADGEIITPGGAPINRNDDSRQSRQAETNEEAVIVPFEPDIALSYIREHEKMEGNLFVDDYVIHSDGSMTIDVSYKGKRQEGASKEEALYARYRIYETGEYSQVE